MLGFPEREHVRVARRQDPRFSEREKLSERAAEGAGGAVEADGVEDGHDDHDDADLRQRRGPAGEDERPNGIYGPRGERKGDRLLSLRQKGVRHNFSEEIEPDPA